MISSGLARFARSRGIRLHGVRFTSGACRSVRKYSSSNANEAFTKLTDENDPNRDAFFKYTWGSWLKDDAAQKAKRVTKFSIEGLNSVLNDLYQQSKKASEVLPGCVAPPSYNGNLTVSLPHNLTAEALGAGSVPGAVRITSMASIHEGKHHRIYKIDTNANKSFVLRIPYALDDETTIAYRLKSEVATRDFVDLKLGLKVPKVYSFGVNSLNPIRQPFILEEYIHGTLLMRKWSPMVGGSTEEEACKKALNEVIEPISKLHAKLSEVTFSAYGSLYFAKDCDGQPAYANETNADLAGRWRIGPTTERAYWRKKSAMKFSDLKKYLGPWKSTDALEIVAALGAVEAENAKARLALKQADATPEANVDEATLRSQIYTFENLQNLAPVMIDLNSKKIGNMAELLKPRLYHPDLDPMNVILNENDNGTPYLVDFESTSIKPFFLQRNPQFVAYDGPKVYDLQRDVKDFNDMSPEGKAQCEFMYKRTRNQFLWESALNTNAKHLIASVAPTIKLLRRPYTVALERKTDREYLLIDEAIVQLIDVWEVFAKHELVKAQNFPLHFSEDWLKAHSEQLNSYHESLIAQPFAATQGWMPQDLFDNYVKLGMLVKDPSGNYRLKSDDGA